MNNSWRSLRKKIRTVKWLSPIFTAVMFVVSKTNGLWRSLRKKIRTVKWLSPIFTAAITALVIAVLLLVFLPWYGDPSEFIRGIYIEAGGAVMDIVVFGIIIAWLTSKTSQNQEIARQMELIDDYKKWDSDEAHYRISGAIRRLNKLNHTVFDFSGLELNGFDFRWHEIESIAGSTFYDGTWATGTRRDQVTLKNVGFNGVDCRRVVFSKFHPFSGFDLVGRFATFRDCNFQGAQLQEAVFRGAYLEWSETPPEEMGELENVEEGGVLFRQTYYPPFDEADLKGSSFEDVRFQNADFRNAVNIEDCTFAGAKGLEECLFDNEEVKEQILRKASSGPA